MAAQGLGHRLDFAGRHALHVHLGQRADQRLLRALVALEQLGRKPPAAILRHPQLQRPHPGDQRAAVIAAAVGQSRLGSFPLLGPDRFAHLRFQRGLEQRLQRRLQEIFVALQQLFHVNQFGLTFAFGHGVLPCYGGDVNVTRIP